MKKLLLFAIVASIATTSFSQDIQKKIDEHAKDKKTAENAAKADVFVIDKKKISDTTVAAKTVNKTMVSSKKIKAKKKVKRHS
jgi:hypothetical protein